MNINEKLINEVKLCGTSIIENAEKIVNDFDFQTDLVISIRISMSGEVPIIKVVSEYIPEMYIHECLSYTPKMHDPDEGDTNE